MSKPRAKLSEYKPPVKASDSNPVVVTGWPGTTQPTKEYLVAVRYSAFRHQDKDDEIIKFFSEKIGECKGARGCTTDGTEVFGFLLLTFTLKAHANRAESHFGNKDILADGVRICVRDFERRGEIYEGCKIEDDKGLVLDTKTEGTPRGTFKFWEVPFGNGDTV